MSGFVGAQHEFHDAAFVQGWADRFVPTPPRIALFDLILEHVSAPGLPNAHVTRTWPRAGIHGPPHSGTEPWPQLRGTGLLRRVLRCGEEDNRQLHAAGKTDQSGPDGSSLATLVVATTGSNSLDLGPARSGRAAGGRERVRALPRSFAGRRRPDEWRLYQAGWDVLDLRARSIRSWPASRIPSAGRLQGTGFSGPVRAQSGPPYLCTELCLPDCREVIALMAWSPGACAERPAWQSWPPA